MSRWMIRRIAEAVATTVVALLLLIVLLHLLPGDPLSALLGDRGADPAVRADLERCWSSHRNTWQSVTTYFGCLARGDLSYSLSKQEPVLQLIRERLGPTLLLGGLTLLIDFTIGLALGVWSALHPDTWRARLISATTIVGYTLPSFVVGMLPVWIFAIKLPWLPTGQLSEVTLPVDSGAWAVFADHIKHLILPLTAMVIATIAVPLRQQRTAAMTTAAAPWVLAARARGVRPFAVAWRHCWRPALTPIVTLLGLWVPMLVAGAVFVESVFSWPGMGSLLADATFARDVPVVVAAGFVVIVVVQIGSLLADALYHIVDPAQRST